MHEWFDPKQWPAEELRGLNDVVDVEDISMMNMTMNNGVLASYQQCHFTPDYWRNYTVIGSKGRLENFGDSEGAVVKIWNSRRSGYREDADVEIEVPISDGGHGGADPLLIDEFLSFVRKGTPTKTSPLAARAAVAAGCAATHSLRNGSQPVVVSEVPAEIQRYFDNNQVLGAP